MPCKFRSGATAWPCGCPKALVEKMGLRAGDELDIVDVVERTLIVRRRTAARLPSSAWLPSTGRFLPDYKFDRDEANER